ASLFEHSCDKKDLVVHAQSEDDGKGQNRHDRIDGAGRTVESEEFAAIAQLKDENQRAEGSADGEQIEQDCFYRREQGTQADEEREKAARQDADDNSRQPRLHHGIVISVDGGDTADSNNGAGDAGDGSNVGRAHVTYPLDLLVGRKRGGGEQLNQ